MSPIGRVFVILNLILAGVFVGFAGTYLQKQDDWKTKYLAENKTHLENNTRNEASIAELQAKVNAADVSKTKLETELANLKNDNDKISDENKGLHNQLAAIEGDVKQITSNANAMRSEVAAAFSQAKEAYDKALAAEQAKDGAVREKDDAVAKLRDAEQKIASQTDTLGQKEVQIASLTKEKSELGLLVDVAKAKGFLESMAVPALIGTVSHVAGKLVTVSVTDNPENAEIKAGYRFAIYDASGYKGEARVTAADSDKKVAFCTLDIVKGEVKVGDKAATQTN